MTRERALNTKKRETNPMKAFACLALALLAAGRPFAEEKKPGKIERKVSVVGFVDVGQVVQGSVINDDGTNPPLELNNAFLNRDGIALTYSGTMDERLHVNIGVGGLFWKPIPETSNPASTRINFGPGISEASAGFDFTPSLTWKFGFFGYDYNPDAKNLGEYLLRSEAYPTTIHTGGTGGWVWMNDSKYKSMGTKVSWDLLGGNLRQDFLLFSEFNEVPIFDFSPSYVATAKVGKAFEFGAGFSLHRWLAVKPSVTTPTRSSNSYIEVDNFPVIPSLNDTGASGHHQLGFAGGTLKDMEGHIGNYTDSAGTPLATVSVDEAGNTIYVMARGDTLRPKSSKALTFKGIKVMARASLDVGALLDMDAGSTGPFKLFAEAAILGVENQPYYYEKIQQRIPLMVGMHVPTFGILSLASIQFEYFKNPYPENSNQQYTNSVPQPALPSGNPALYEINRQAGLYSEDDMKWSVYLQRNLYSGLDLFLQAANDHFRVQDVNAGPSFTPVTHHKSDWYYLLQFQWSM
ncbi:MAG: hypothetical protein JWO30_2252 [Fibrobacteres bacterium]|nr:hypothetical protein [Fibrobacterota bacterium]